MTRTPMNATTMADLRSGGDKKIRKQDSISGKPHKVNPNKPAPAKSSMHSSKWFKNE